MPRTNMHLVFKIFPASSHLNATFNFGSELKRRGYKITYAGNREFEKEVIMQGFNYFIDKDIFPPIIPTLKKVKLFQKIANRKDFKTFHLDYLKGDMFDEIINKLKPDLLIIDSPFVRYCIPLYHKKIPFVIFESMVALNKRAYHPPLNSRIAPKKNIYFRILIEIVWKKYFFSLYFERLFFGRFFSSKSTILKLAKESSFPSDMLDFNRYFHIGLKNIPEIIASPFHFDFPHIKDNNQHYIGASINLERKETSYDFKYLETRRILDNILSFNKTCKPHEVIKLIYCSFGSMAWRYDGLNQFYKKLVKVFLNKKNVHLIMSIGHEINYHQFKGLPPHIQVLQKVPQLEILKKMDLMITHGGMNTISECILSEVPMLVYPGTDEIDQAGNASRVNYHRLGLVGDLVNDTQLTIEKKIDKMLNDNSYQKNVTEMKNLILNMPNEGIQLIDSILERDLTKNGFKYVDENNHER